MNASSNRRRSLSTCYVLATIALAGCSDGIGVQPPLLTAAVSEVSLTFGQGAVSGHFTISVENRGIEPVLVEPCAVALERFEVGQWTAVWFQICALGDSQFVEVAPGESYSYQVRVNAVLGRAPFEMWREPTDGDYRARVTVFGLDDQALPVITDSFPLTS
jgi:hypothetical protein